MSRRSPLPLAVVLALGLACTPAAQSPPAPAITATQWPEADALFHKDPRWLGADSAYSISLDSQRTLWLFGDTFVATSPANVRTESHMVHSTIAVQTGMDPTTASIAFAWSGGGTTPGSFFAEDGDRYFWPEEGIRIDGTLVIFLARIRATPGQGLGFAPDGCRALVIANPDDDPKAWRTTAVDLTGTPGMPSGIDLSTAVVRQGDDVYMLAVAESNDHAGYLAKARATDLAAGNFSAIAWWNGSAYVVGAAPAKVMDNAGPENSLHFDATRKKWIHVRTDGFGATTIVVSFADRIEGPWSAPRTIFRPPEDDRSDAFVYAAKGHPELTAVDADLVVTYATNTMADFNTLVHDSLIYYPRFVKVRLGP
jgi:hypothetical protein